MNSWQMKNEANQTMTMEFILLGFGGGQMIQILLLLLFLIIYIVTITGNLLIVLLVIYDQHFHRPMYYFLGNLSCLETFSSSVILPRMLYSLSTGDRSITFIGCIMQFYIFGVFVSTECLLLAVMSFDRYLAICKALHYPSYMTNRLCIQLSSASWIGGGLAITITTSLLLTLVFRGTNEIDHFFCDFGPVRNLFYKNNRIVDVLVYIQSSLFALPPFTLTLVSYVCIITSILRIKSTSGRQKAFSTCSSHLIVVTVFYSTLIIVYVFPKTSILRDLNKFFSLLYTILTPLVNPLVYSLRNKEVRKALKKNCQRLTIMFSSRGVNMT